MIKTCLEELVCKSKHYFFPGDIYIVANTCDRTPQTGPEGIVHASPKEFFSRTEFAEIASAVFDVFGYVKVFYSELEFISYVTKNAIQRDDCIVYNLARDGVNEGKKSLVPAACDLINLSYTGSNAFVISLLRNKYVYSIFLAQHGIPIPKTYVYEIDQGFLYGRPLIGQTVIVKNICESASMGMSEENVFAYSDDQVSATRLARLADKMGNTNLLVQEYIAGDECEVWVFEKDGRYLVLDPVQIDIHSGAILDDSTSQEYRYSFSLLSDKYGPVECYKLKEFAKRAAKLLNIKNFGRLDFRIDPSGNAFIIDIAGTPYSIRHSSISYLFQKVYGLEYKDIHRVILHLAYEKNETML